MQSDYSLELGRTPTTKAVGSEYVTKVGTDGFSRRSSTVSFSVVPMGL